MTFEVWWKLYYGNTPLEDGNGGIVAMQAWDAAVAAERERCANLAGTLPFGVGDMDDGRSAQIAAAIREG